jgi:dTDP-4-dehydrorhamnose reductase
VKLLVCGGHGQLGRTLARIGVHAGHDVVAPGRSELDITHGGQLARALDSIAPDAVINAAGFTAVDAAQAQRDLAFAINGAGAGLLARGCSARRIPLVHVSTDHVFDGRSREAIAEDAPPSPINAYGASKLDGEERVIAAGGCVVRTSWLFATGGHGFVQAIVRAARSRATLQVVDDQWGCPTWADDLADALIRIALGPEHPPVLHVRGAEPTSRFELACAIVDELRERDAIRGVTVEPIKTSADPALAPRPPCTILGMARATALGLSPRAWRPGLDLAIARELES